MSGTAIIGLQWGDEAKGKIVDLLTEQHEIVVRYQGGANAGHTVVTNGKKFKLSLIPSGIFRPHVQCVIAGGVVLSPPSLLQEINTLLAQGIKIGHNLMISNRAHVIFPWHGIADRLFNNIGNNEPIGTTLRGIGPCYEDKVGRSLAIRVGDLYEPDFKAKVEHITNVKNQLFSGLLSNHCGNTTEVPVPDTELNSDVIYKDYAGYAEQLRPYIADTTNYLLNAVDADKRILFEGAQGSLLDIDHGTFPYVTSSNSSGTGIFSGSGVPPYFLKKIVGIAKAYTTRVGGGPCPTEQDNDIGKQIRDRGNEYGTVTKRPRRCGWFDAVAVRYSARLSGVNTLAMMLLDVLSGFDSLQICTAYEINGQRIEYFPSQINDLRKAIPIYETLPGWKDEITAVTKYEDLPVNAKLYIKRIAELIGKPIEIVSVGPDRLQTIFL
ncbi:MAG: adenylosuccinate synthase [Planctomycetaceae bacterium]|nr:adenylosuccinate synthase [Planctomycetaceae bacterium]